MQDKFIALALEHKALQFGEFTLKSGRKSPYFFNTGAFQTGEALAALSHFYAHTIASHFPAVEVVFGPAYKGIPLAVSTSIALSHLLGRPIGYTFDRKEVKDHGEGGTLVGSPLSCKQVVLIDDVVTAGTAMRHVLPLVRKAGGTVIGLTLALDRQEKGIGTQSAVAELATEWQIPILSIITVSDLIAYATNHKEWTVHVDAMLAYRKEFGI